MSLKQIGELVPQASSKMKNDEALSGFLRGTTICPLADALAMPIQSFFTHFMDEFEAAVADAAPVGGAS